MNYDKAAELYVGLRAELEEIDREFSEKKATVRKKMATLESWFTAKATEEGLKDIKTDFGTAYWSTHHSASVASREEFFQFCKEREAWDLLEARASKTAVKSFIETEGAPPPGINFSSTSVFNFRKATKKV